MLAYDYSGMTCDRCGKHFPLFNSELKMVPSYNGFVYLCNDCQEAKTYLTNTTSNYEKMCTKQTMNDKIAL